MQVIECFSNLLFSIRTHFAVDSALLEEFSFPQALFIVATHSICKRVSHLSWTTVTVISRLQFAIQILGHCGCTMRARNRARRSARMHGEKPSSEKPSASLRAHARGSSAPTRAPPRAAPLSARARTRANARAPLSARACTHAHARAPLSARARAPLRACGAGESVIPTHTSHPFPPRHSHLLPPAGLAVGRRCKSRRAPRWTHPATAACGQWTGRRTSAHGCRPGPRRLPARPVSGCCWHSRPASAAGTAGPRWLPARPARLGCRHGRPAAIAGTACTRRLHENGSENS
jgi:hypothetical protein